MTLKFALEVIAGLIAGIIILSGFGMWRLSSGPISLDFLTTTIEDTLNAEQDLVVIKIEDTVLTWGGWSRAIDVVARDVFISQKNGQKLASFPEVSIGLSLRALSEGVIAPTSLELNAPELSITRYDDGHFGFGLKTLENQVEVGSVNELNSIYQAISDEPGHGGFFGYLTRISIKKAMLTFTDRQENSVWHASDASLIFERTKEQFTGNLKTQLMFNDENIDFSIGAIHQYGDDRIYLLANLDGLLPKMLLQIVPALEGFVGGEKPINGNLELALDENAKVRGANFLISSDYGEVTGDLSLDKTGVNAKVDLQVTDFDFSALAKGAEELALLTALEAKVNANVKASGKVTGEIDEMTLKINIVDGKVNLPNLYSEKLIFKSANFEIVANDNFNQVDIVKGEIDIGEALIYLTGQTHKSSDVRDINFAANLTDFQMKNLYKYWPEFLGVDARNWVVPNIAKGDISAANIDISGKLATDGSNEFDLIDLSGKIVGTKVEVNYLAPMRPATGGDAVAEFGPSWFKVFINDGYVDNVKLNSGYIEIKNIGDTDDFIADLDLSGPVAEFLLAIDEEPLSFLDDLKLEREGATGRANVNVSLAFPLINDLKKDQVIVRAEADIFDLYLPDAYDGQSAVAENLNLVVDNNGMDVSGQATLTDSLLNIKWHENFDVKVPLKSRFIIDGALNKEGFGSVGFDLGEFASGDFQVALAVDEMRDGTKTIDSSIDVDQAYIDIPLVSWEKEINTPGVLSLKAKIQNNGNVTIAPLSFTSSGLIFDGKLTMQEGEDQVSLLNIYRLDMGQNSLTGSIVQNKKNHFTARVSGPKFDMAGLTATDDTVDEKADIAKDTSFSLDVIADFAVLTDGPNSKLNDVTFDLVYNNDNVQVFNLNSLAGTAPFSINYNPARFGGYDLKINSSDAGAVMEQLDVSGRVRGGGIIITGSRERADDPISGVVNVTNFTLLEAPAVAKILEFMSLTGITSALGQSGLPFTNLDAEFEYNDGVLNITRGLAFGNSIGITTIGKIDVDNKEYALKGTVSPAYSLSRAVSWIPLLGTLLSGDEGIFAARYTVGGAMDDPDVSVNPISALTPGILRNIFNVFGDDETLSRDKGANDDSPPENTHEILNQKTDK